MFINDIKKDEDKIFEEDEYGKSVTKTPHKCGDLLDVVKIILEFNETIQPYLN